MNVTIRKGEKKDLETLISFLHELFSMEDDFASDAERQRTGLQLLLADPYLRAVFVADADGSPVGMVTAQLVVSTAEGGFSVLLEDLYVHDRFRRMGIASQLLERIIAWGGRRGALRVQLVADARNDTALRFYGQAGLFSSRMTALYGRADTVGKHADRP